MLAGFLQIMVNHIGAPSKPAGALAHAPHIVPIPGEAVVGVATEMHATRLQLGADLKVPKGGLPSDPLKSKECASDSRLMLHWVGGEF